MHRELVDAIEGNDTEKATELWSIRPNFRGRLQRGLCRQIWVSRDSKASPDSRSAGEVAVFVGARSPSAVLKPVTAWRTSAPGFHGQR
jgi:hypothetical protein